MEKFTEFDISIIFKTFTNEKKLENIAPANSMVTPINDENILFSDMIKWCMH